MLTRFADWLIGSPLGLGIAVTLVVLAALCGFVRVIEAAWKRWLRRGG